MDRIPGETYSLEGVAEIPETKAGRPGIAHTVSGDLELIPEEVPSSRGYQGHSKYEQTLKNFVDSGMSSARVNPSGKVSNHSLTTSFRSWITKLGLTGKVKVIVRGERVYLTK